jgi:hypothetical protein
MCISPNRVDGPTGWINSLKEARTWRDMNPSAIASGDRPSLLRLMEVGQGRSLGSGYELGNTAMLHHNDLILVNILVGARGLDLERAFPYEEQMVNAWRVQSQPTLWGQGVYL